MAEWRLVSTPMSTTNKLSKDGGTPLNDCDATQYRIIVGGLQYLTITRPVIAFAINKVCQYLHMPFDAHWLAVKQIIHYLKFSSNVGLKIHKSSSLLLSAFTNADKASCVDDLRSTSGFACSSAPIWSPRAHASRCMFLGLAWRRSIRPWPMLLWSLFGCSCFSLNLVFSNCGCSYCGVTILGLCTCLQT